MNTSDSKRLWNELREGQQLSLGDTGWQSWDSSSPGSLTTLRTVLVVPRMPRLATSPFQVQFGPSGFQGWRGADSGQHLPGPPSLPVLSQAGHHAQDWATPATVSSDRPWDAMVDLFALGIQRTGPLCSKCLTTVPRAVIKIQPLPGKHGQRLTDCHRALAVPTLRCPGYGTWLPGSCRIDTGSPH